MSYIGQFCERFRDIQSKVPDGDVAWVSTKVSVKFNKKFSVLSPTPGGNRVRLIILSLYYLSLQQKDLWGCKWLKSLVGKSSYYFKIISTRSVQCVCKRLSINLVSLILKWQEDFATSDFSHLQPHKSFCLGRPAPI